MVLIHPASTHVDPAIPDGAIAADAVIHPGCRLVGADLRVGAGCEIGREGPVTLIDCQLGDGVTVAGGFCEGSVFLDGATVGSGAHIRPGCLLEEEAGVAHSVGLKQTLLLPFVTCGSLINFCDCLMAGGTSRKDHSEVGSSFVHFNFTPHADKATPSLIGDVPRGVLLDQPPIFLGGQGGMVGPVRVAYGTVLAAGSILRRDVTEPGQLVLPAGPKSSIQRPYATTHYSEVRRRMDANLEYLGNVVALRAWYRDVRIRFLSPDLHAGALRVLDRVIAERTKWLGRMAALLETSRDWLRDHDGSDALVVEHTDWLDAWPERAARIAALEPGPAPDFGLDRTVPYVDAVRALDTAQRANAAAWLTDIVQELRQ